MAKGWERRADGTVLVLLVGDVVEREGILNTLCQLMLNHHMPAALTSCEL